MNFIRIIILTIALLPIIILIIVFVLEIKDWNNGLCIKHNRKWTYCKGTLYICQPRTDCEDYCKREFVFVERLERSSPNGTRTG